MNDEDIPSNAFLERERGLVVFVPEKTIEPMKYDETTWKRLFPPLRSGAYEKLQLSNIAKYSMATPAIANGLEAFLRQLTTLYMPDRDLASIVITETNGGVGGLSIRLATMFDTLNIVEIQWPHAVMLKNNLLAYGFGKASPQKKIKIHCKDYLDILYDLKQDIIISDPPWGGLSYAKQRSIRLGINNVNIVHIINRLHEAGAFKIFVLLAMRNFDLQRFINGIKAKTLIIHNMGKHYFIAIIAD